MVGGDDAHISRSTPCIDDFGDHWLYSARSSNFRYCASCLAGYSYKSLVSCYLGLRKCVKQSACLLVSLGFCSGSFIPVGDINQSRSPNFFPGAPPVRPSNAPLERLPLMRIGPHPSIASNSSIIPEIILSPLSQNLGSDASSPNGASSSLWCFDPPAFNISKYLS